MARPGSGSPLFARLLQLLPKAKILPAARTLVADLHGFVSMEREGARASSTEWPVSVPFRQKRPPARANIAERR